MSTLKTQYLCFSKMKKSPITSFSTKEANDVSDELEEWAKENSEIAKHFKNNDALREFTVSALSLSPFLRDTLRRKPNLLACALNDDAISKLNDLIVDIGKCWLNDEKEPISEAALMMKLREAKTQASLVLAFHDLAKLIPAEATCQILTNFACAALSTSINHLLRIDHDRGKLKLPDADNPSIGSGLIVLAMGKMGAGELNYSSDIDLVIFHDPLAGVVDEPLEATELFSKQARKLIRILQERTGAGYVFRTDLRLRPDPGSTPLVIPVEAAIIYYEGRGQNWERSAYIKANAVAGDIEAGRRFLDEMRPFVFRKYLDYSTIADIHSIKSQIHSHKGFGDIALNGHNVKLGRGGIREIEFFVQTQQLIAGGRLPALRTRSTIETLGELCRAKWIEQSVVDDLTEAYWFLRDIEHRIQMTYDEQTHLLPEDEGELLRIAKMAGFETVQKFGEEFLSTLKVVEARYGELFEQDGSLEHSGERLNFMSEEADGETLAALSKLNFERPRDVWRLIRSWHFGRYKATQSADMKQRLAAITPDLLASFSKTKKADEALMKFDTFLSGLPSGIQLFSLLDSNRGLMELLVNIMASAPRLADLIAKKPHVFDGMLDPALLAELPTQKYLKNRLDIFLTGDFHYEEILDRLRIFAAEQKFLIGVRLLTQGISGERAAQAFSDLADLMIERALVQAIEETKRQHGNIAGSKVVVLGMGKLGSGELTAGSDIDVIVIYNYDETCDMSDGLKPIDPLRYYTRLTQRLIAALSAPMSEGRLYEVDLRLRPSGNKGPVATTLKSFRKYQKNDAWTWEHMALSRARVVAGDPSLAGSVRSMINEILEEDKDENKIALDVVEMRDLLENEKPAKNDWDIKLIPGGLIDIEFIAQYLRLVEKIGPSPQGEIVKTADMLELGRMRLIADEQGVLKNALSLYANLSQVIRLCIDDKFEVSEAPAGLQELICKTINEPDIKRAELNIRDTAQAVRTIFNRLLRDGQTPDENLSDLTKVVR